MEAGADIMLFEGHPGGFNQAKISPTHFSTKKVMKKRQIFNLFILAGILGLTLPAIAQNSIALNAGVFFTNFKWKSDPTLKSSPLPGYYAGAQFKHTWNKT